MTRAQFVAILVNRFPYEITPSQYVLLQNLTDFLATSEKQIFVLKGYAGTGKTSIVSTLVQNLWQIKYNFILLAPTGRAAKIMTSYANQPASTVHRHLYYTQTDNFGKLKFTLRKNKQRRTVFVVDEASMISGISQTDSIFDSASLLSDLIFFVYTHPSNKLILIGDTAQLPPIGTELSPALNPVFLQQNFDIPVVDFELKQVVRQSLDSGILFNATKIRQEIEQEYPDKIKFNGTGFTDFVRLQNGYDIQDAIEEAYAEQNFEETAIIVRSNKRANLYNQQIRNRVLLRDNELDAGDYLMVVKNNYYWLPPDSKAGFIANGDIVEVLEIYKFVNLYGFRFAEVKLRMVDYPDEPPVDAVIMLDTLYLDTPSLPYNRTNDLYLSVNEDFKHLKTKWQRYRKVKENKYFNALQVKFSYALTAHKSQGGQWNNVFVEQPYRFDVQNKEDLRWLYTAFTRARKKLYLIGFNSDLFLDDGVF